MIHFHESCHSFDSFKRMQCPPSYCVPFWLVMLPSILLCRSMFKGKLKKFYLCNQNSLCVSTFDSVLWLPYSHHSRTLFQVSCHRCGTHHGPPSTRLSPSTSAHHPRISLRNKFSTLRSVCLNDRFSRSWQRFTHWPLIDRIDWVFKIKTSIHVQ